MDDNLLAAPLRLKMVPSMMRASRFTAAMEFLLRSRAMVNGRVSRSGLLGDNWEMELLGLAG